MGEAKRRATNDPTFGKPRRGLVISCPIELGPENSVTIKTTELDPQDMRASLLFWDQLAWPTCNAIHTEGGSDVEFLIGAGIMQRPSYPARGTMSEILVELQEQAFIDLDGAHPGCWSISQGENSILARHGKLLKEQGISLELMSAIPVPDKDVPLNEILEFRLKRYDELLALRGEIETLVARINSSDDPKSEIRSCVSEIDRKCEAAIRVCSEWKFPVRISNLKSSFNIKPFGALRDAAVAYPLVEILGMSTTALALAIGAHAASSIEIKGDFGWSGLKDRTNPYRYVSHYHKELF